MKMKRGEIAKIILGVVGVTGMLVASVALPGITKIFPLTYRSHYQGRSIEQSIRNLLKRKLIKFAKTSGGWKLILTDKGLEELSNYETGQKLLSKPKRWDKKWRLLIFDIEERRKKTREQIRRTLVYFGFYRLQDSVWVYPYECEEIIELFRTKYGIRRQALYIRAEKIAKDQRLRKYFQLNNA